MLAGGFELGSDDGEAGPIVWKRLHRIGGRLRTRNQNRLLRRLAISAGGDREGARDEQRDYRQ